MMRNAAGTIYRILTPWQNEVVSLDDVVTILGCAFGPDCWHHITATLREYDRDETVSYKDTSMYLYLKQYCPTDTLDLVGGSTHSNLPLFVYPWGTFKKGVFDAAKDVRVSRFCGPSSDEFIELEFYRTIALYKQFKKSGYTPTAIGGTFMSGTWLIGPAGRPKFAVLQGNHRMAILAHLRVGQVLVRKLPDQVACVRRDEVSLWPRVVDGSCSERDALRVFDYLYSATGASIAEYLANATSLPNSE